MKLAQAITDADSRYSARAPVLSLFTETAGGKCRHIPNFRLARSCSRLYFPNDA